MTRKNKAMLEQYNRMTAEYLSDIYKTCSAAKTAAYDKCLELEREMDGWDARIKKCGTAFFTYAFKYVEDNKIWLCYMTGRHIYKFAIE